MPESVLAAALVEALAELCIVAKNNTASIDTRGGNGFSYEYADIADVVKATRPTLAKHGILALTPVHAYGNGLACTVMLVHKSGERIEFEPFPFAAGSTAQATGSAVTYHRRYALMAALGIAADNEDDDGSTATKAQANSTPARTQGKQRSGPPICPICNEPATEGIKRQGDGYVHTACLEAPFTESAAGQPNESAPTVSSDIQPSVAPATPAGVS